MTNCTQRQSQKRSQFVQEVVKGWDALLEAFTFAGLRNHLVRSTVFIKRVSWQDLPVVKYTLREGLAASVGPQVRCET